MALVLSASQSCEIFVVDIDGAGDTHETYVVYNLLMVFMGGCRSFGRSNHHNLGGFVLERRSIEAQIVSLQHDKDGSEVQKEQWSFFKYTPDTLTHTLIIRTPTHMSASLIHA